MYPNLYVRDLHFLLDLLGCRSHYVTGFGMCLQRGYWAHRTSRVSACVCVSVSLSFFFFDLSDQLYCTRAAHIGFCVEQLFLLQLSVSPDYSAARGGGGEGVGDG